MIVYGRNPVREALRGRRRVHRVYATGAHDLWPGDVEVVIAEAYEIEERCGSPDHQGVCAEVEAYPYVDADSLRPGACSPPPPIRTAPRARQAY